MRSGRCWCKPQLSTVHGCTMGRGEELKKRKRKSSHKKKIQPDIRLAPLVFFLSSFVSFCLSSACRLGIALTCSGRKSLGPRPSHRTWGSRRAPSWMNRCSALEMPIERAAPPRSPAIPRQENKRRERRNNALTYISIYMYVCVCVRVCAMRTCNFRERVASHSHLCGTSH